MIDVYGAVSTVYVLADLQQRVATVEGLKRWHYADKLGYLHKELSAALKTESDNLARAFYDYIVLTAAGEARHARRHCCTRHWSNFTVGADRNEAWNDAQCYSPESLLSALNTLFNKSVWVTGSSYGGKSWGRIVEAGLLYRKVPALVFLDHAVDLSHNSGLFLDKGIIFDMPNSTYKLFLDAKTAGLLWAWNVCWSGRIRIHESVCSLVVEAAKLLGLPTTKLLEEIGDPDWADERIEWGCETFLPQAVEHDENWSPNDEDEEENYEYEDDNYFYERPARVPQSV